MSVSTHILDIKYIEEYTNAELKKAVEELSDEVKRLDLENQVYENFLIANEPSLIAGMNKALEAVKKFKSSYQPQLPAPIQPLAGPGSPGAVSRVSTGSASTPCDTQSIYEPSVNSRAIKGPRINFSTKTDLVLREIEFMQNSLAKFIASSHRRKCHLRAEIEESDVRYQEVKENRNNFEQSIVIGAVEELTQKIPAEKFIR